MATVAFSAPLPESSALVEDSEFQDHVQRSRALIQKILQSIPNTHKACVHAKALQLNSPENGRLLTIVSIIGIPSAPVLKNISENSSLENSLSQIYEGLQLHQILLTSVSNRLEKKDKVDALIADISDLTNQVKKMLRMTPAEEPVPPTPPQMTLRMPGDYEVQVAAHWTLLQLQDFGQDVNRCLRILERSNDEEETKS
ncbi:colony stimulating factor 3 (granulocyte) a [Cololabis saira]|uniref:colony stimulating factor 3 (granulocyte) a n=1 Tax=Cololabis saira TaxID=129043 RepID=UPI002AD3171A|nr:colony stimulating factor 3 (granulocyte) a [Cololabis saira]